MTLTAINPLTNERIDASRCRDVRLEYPNWHDLRCPISGLEVIPRRESYSRGYRVGAHFVIKGRNTLSNWPEEVVFDPELGKDSGGIRTVGGESPEHREGKAFAAFFIRQELEKLGLEALVQYEERIEVEKGRFRIADVSVTYPCGFKEVHEVQLATITPDDLADRTYDYAAVGIPASWWLGNRAASSSAVRDCVRDLQADFYEFEFAENLHHDPTIAEINSKYRQLIGQ